jgi:DNA-binding transcriptional regulator GbsR (MarR family)
MMGVVSSDGQRSGGLAHAPELRFIERFALLMTEAGMARMPARVFAAVLADEDGRMTASELAERLHVSPAAISGAVRTLTQLHMLTRGREPGARRDHYEMVHDQWPEMFVYRSAVLKNWEDALAEGVELLGPGPAAERLDETRAFFEFVRGELPGLMERWRERRGEPA